MLFAMQYQFPDLLVSLRDQDIFVAHLDRTAVTRPRFDSFDPVDPDKDFAPIAFEFIQFDIHIIPP